MTDWTPPPPGDTREQLPDDILQLIDVPSYTSTACETAQALTAAADRHPGQAGDLEEWAHRMHQRCRRNHKFTGVHCDCSCH
ncbi:hypothetical protein ABZ953_06700 [Streptomyces sp. NPDC046465]|uniref:hypothetical protein n=1 Tax=Streptomyces sp. NPDC046465 TaxID=3155810 RepID=UPI0033F8D11C